ncbi:alpha/beta hydrolase family protein [Paludibaculum fermentans]|uniref:alpha/beta hydrolase family protein n=1 Tax=Paludibaculum fermentans TaxID=1473598 RepID=UPI003EBE4D3A
MSSFRPAILLLACMAPLVAQKSPVVGSWEGSLEAGGTQLRLRLHISQDAAGTLLSKFDSPDQGAIGVPVTSTSFQDGVLKWEVATLRASFEGKLNTAGTEIEGRFEQGRQSRLVLKRMEEVEERKRRQEPRPPYPYQVEDVKFPSKAAGVTLAGTMTIPRGAGPFPAVALITGSGPQDRDEALRGHKPFAVLADHLTRQGIAVLRYDDRGIGQSTGTFATATSTDFSRDAEGALDYLIGRKDVDPKRVGLAGHSEGGIIAPMVAARRPEVAFVVMLAGTGVTGAEVIVEQGARQMAAAGESDEKIRKDTELQMKIVAVVASEKDNAAARIKLLEILPAGELAEREARRMTTPWMREFLFYDPAPALEKVKCPVLAVNGEKDLQVLPDQNLPRIEAALKKGGNRDFSIVRLPGLNHLFQTATTGAAAEYAQIEETMAPVLLDTVSRWIRQHTGLEH